MHEKDKDNVEQFVFGEKGLVFVASFANGLPLFGWIRPGYPRVQTTREASGGEKSTLSTRAWWGQVTCVGPK